MFYASYFYNPNTWFSGILLGIFLMAIAFMGYVLPFHFLFLKLCYLYPSFGDHFIHYLHQLLGFVLEKVFIFQILVN
eukprot:UN1856